MKSMIIAASLTATVTTANAGPNMQRLTAEDRAVCEERRDHARPAYKQIILNRCIANFLAKYERTIEGKETQ